MRRALPVTTMPLFRVPIHFSYLLYLGGKSPALARLYWRTALRMCRLRRVEPSVLLHPLDFRLVQRPAGALWRHCPAH